MKLEPGMVAFVTGAASGIGFGLAQTFASIGMRLVMADIDAPGLEAAAARIAGGGAEVLPLVMDVASETDWARCPSEAERAFGAVDLLCNNAGVIQGQRADGSSIPLLSISPAHWRMIMQINIDGAFLGARAVVPGMLARGRGHVVNTASLAGLISPPGMGPYATSKHAAVAFSEELYAELAPRGIGVSVLCPGAVEGKIYANSAARRQATLAGVAGAESELATTRVTTFRHMDARRVGEFVVAAIEDGRFYIVTHPEYAALVEERFAAIRSAFGASAEPGHTDPPAMLQRSRNPLYAAACN